MTPSRSNVFATGYGIGWRRRFIGLGIAPGAAAHGFNHCGRGGGLDFLDLGDRVAARAAMRFFLCRCSAVRWYGRWLKMDALYFPGGR